MRNWLTVSILAVTTIFAMSVVAHSQTPKPAAAGAASSMGDIAGTWTHDRRNNADVAPGQAPRPYMYFTKEPIPMLPWAQEFYQAARKGQGELRPDFGRTDMDPSQYPYCMPFGFPRAFTYEDAFEVVQHPDRVYFVFESSQVQRIYTDGRQRMKGVPLTFMGQSIGHWEGDTLVVETTDMSDLTWLDTLGHPHSDALRVTQHIRRLDPLTLEIRFLFDDPKTFSRPWEGRQLFRLRESDDPSKDFTSDVHMCEEHVIDDFTEKILGIQSPDDAWRQLRREGVGY